MEFEGDHGMTILQALAGHYDRLAARGVAPAFGFSNEKISYAILLSRDGQAVDVQSLQDMSGKKPQPSIRAVPQPVKRTSGIASNFLWDKTAYALGVKVGASPAAPVFAEREFAAFRTLHEALLADSDDEGLSALLAFLRSWEPTTYGTLPHAEDMLAANANVVFRLDDGERRFLHERSAARIVWANHLDGGGSDGVCLVTGNHGPVARLHPAVKGVRDTRSSGARIVSFNLDAFESFDKRQGANAPVSERAAFAYATALNTLLAHGSRQRIQIGNTTTVFWAESADPAQSEAAEDLFSMLAEPPTDEQEAARVRDKLQAITEGQPLAEAVPDVREDTRFYVLGLAPNAARLSIRFWYAQTIGELAERIVQHWRDLQLEPAPWTSPPPVWRLLYETAPQRKAENIPPTLSGALMYAILTGAPYPRSLLAAVVTRMRADKNINGTRAAICKAVMVRNHRLGFEKETAPVSLNPDETNPAYRLGRLFAVYEGLQRSALGRVNTTVKDRYFGAASATPASVFPLLVRNSAHHLSSLRKNDKGGLAHWFDTEIDAILAGVDTAFPRSFGIEDQGRFALGYHHQRAQSQRSADPQDDNPENHTESEDR